MLLRKALVCIGHQKHRDAEDLLEAAATCGLDAVKDNNQMYVKENFSTYHRYYTAFKRIKYEVGAKACLMQIVEYLKRMKISKEKKTKLLANIVLKYENSGGNKNDVKIKWHVPLS